jgi:hypothetical protein
MIEAESRARRIDLADGTIGTWGIENREAKLAHAKMASCGLSGTAMGHLDGVGRRRPMTFRWSGSAGRAQSLRQRRRPLADGLRSIRG